jgi:quercetin dioxygenase-like cupin family protein
MPDRTIHNPVSGERITFIETSRETAAARTVVDVDVKPSGGVPSHRHGHHEEHIEVLEGELEITQGGTSRRLGPGETVVIERGAAHTWRNASRDRELRFRATMTPGYPEWETFLRLWFGLARDGALRPNGIPRRLSDMGLLLDADPSIATGVFRLVAPIARWAAGRREARKRAAELTLRYGLEPGPTFR